MLDRKKSKLGERMVAVLAASVVVAGLIAGCIKDKVGNTNYLTIHDGGSIHLNFDLLAGRARSGFSMY
jgi:hypothetical protein